MSILNINSNRYKLNISKAKMIAFVGMMAATIEAGKLALASVPNVEIVTLLCAAYGYCFGASGVVAVLIFVLLETLIWGFNTWVISYLIYWPLVCIVFIILGKTGLKNRYVITLIVVLLTFFFGVLTSFVDVGLVSGHFENILKRFSIYYMRGVIYYVVHIVSNAIIFLLVFPGFSKLLQVEKNKLLQNSTLRKN